MGAQKKTMKLQRKTVMEDDDVLKKMVEMQKDVERFGLKNEQDFHSITCKTDDEYDEHSNEGTQNEPCTSICLALPHTSVSSSVQYSLSKLQCIVFLRQREEDAAPPSEDYAEQFAEYIFKDEYETFPEEEHADEEEDQEKECLLVDRYFEDEKKYLDEITAEFGIMYLKRKDVGKDEGKQKRRK